MQREAAEDMTQETLLLLHDKYPEVQDPVEMLPLALRILRFKMATYHRTSSRRGEDRSDRVEDAGLADPSPDPEMSASRSEFERKLAGALPKLGERCRELFRLKLLGCGFEEIRQRLNAQSINTVYTWDSRCRKELLEKLGGDWRNPL
jgi:RNA polymerase sigma-70 factor (ECF subfamily)